MQNGFADVNCDSIKKLVHQKLNFEKLIKVLVCANRLIKKNLLEKLI